jgi:hypothetical protein
MTTEKVIISISTPTGQGVTVNTHAVSDETTQHIRVLGAVEGRSSDQVAEPTHTPIDEQKAPPMPAEQALTPTPKPWETSTDSPKGLNFQPDAALHAKMNWVCDNVPKMSRLRILREGALMLCNALIEKHYKE